MKRFIAGAGVLLLICTTAIAQASLLNEATNGLFRNVSDFVIKPNNMFNTVETKQIIIGGSFDNLGFESNATGGGLIGYFHPGSLPWSVAVSLNLNSDSHEVSSHTVNRAGATINDITYENPAFNEYEGGLRFTLGVPDVLNLTAGLVANFKGSENNKKTTTTTNNGVTTTVQNGDNKLFHTTLGVPIGIQFGSAYNLFEPFFLIDTTTTVPATPNPNAGVENSETTFGFLLYDKLILQDLLPTPFGKETSFWLGIGNVDLKKITELEPPAYTSDISYEVKFATQLGMANMLDFSAAGIEVRFKPMFYVDWLLGTTRSWTLGVTLAAAAGIYAPLGNLPLALFFGVTPALQFYNTAVDIDNPHTGGGTRTDKSASRALRTNILWTGKVGTSILLPQNNVLDITLNVNTGEKSLGLSASMSIAL